MNVITVEIWKDNNLRRKWKSRVDAQFEAARKVYELVEYADVVQRSELTPNQRRLYNIYADWLSAAEDASLEAEIDAHYAMQELDDWGESSHRIDDESRYCRTCGGDGMIDDVCPCEDCDGTGTDLLYW